MSPNSFEEEPRSSAWTPAPQSPSRQYSRVGKKGDEVSWSLENHRETAAGGEVELPVLHGAASSREKISAQSTRWGLIHPVGPGTTNPIPGLSFCR